jgi:putative PIN family toxin of toxin-antitoxin system
VTLFRVVLDTNVLVSSVFNGTGPSGCIVRSWLIGKEVDVITSEPLLTEAIKVLSRAELHMRLGRRSEFAFRLVQALPRPGVIVVPLESVSIVRDASDNRSSRRQSRAPRITSSAATRTCSCWAR